MNSTIKAKGFAITLEGNYWVAILAEKYWIATIEPVIATIVINQ